MDTGGALKMGIALLLMTLLIMSLPQSPAGWQKIPSQFKADTLGIACSIGFYTTIALFVLILIYTNESVSNILLLGVLSFFIGRLLLQWCANIRPGKALGKLLYLALIVFFWSIYIYLWFTYTQD